MLRKKSTLPPRVHLNITRKGLPLLTTCGHPICGVTCTPDTDLYPTFRMGPDYITRCAIVRSKAVQIPEHIQRRLIMPSSTPSFESGHFRKDALPAVARLILPVYDTARSFWHDHNICMIMTSAMLNSGCSVALAQHSLVHHRTPSSQLFKKEPTNF